MVISYLIVQFSDFQERLTRQIVNGNHYVNNEMKTVFQIKEAGLELHKWGKKNLEILKSSFKEPLNYYVIHYEKIPIITPITPTSNMDHQNVIIKLKQNFRIRCSYLEVLIKTLSVCDYVIKHDEIDLEVRKWLSFEEKQILLLKKLSKLYDENFYSVKEILLGNGIPLKRQNEDVELANFLEKKGYINVRDDDTVQITGYGEDYVKKLYEKEKNTAYNSIENIEEKLDEAIRYICELGLDQDKLIKEFRELKDFLKKMDKKNWLQFFLGKLADLSFKGLIKSEYVIDIYNRISDDKLQLPQ